MGEASVEPNVTSICHPLLPISSKIIAQKFEKRVFQTFPSGDYDKWIAKTVQKIGDELPDDQVKFLKESR